MHFNKFKLNSNNYKLNLIQLNNKIIKYSLIVFLKIQEIRYRMLMLTLNKVIRKIIRCQCHFRV
jgi:hypothetical protein